MALPEKSFAVLLHGRRVGTIRQRGDHTRFTFTEEYLDNPLRPTLGLRFEENLRTPYASALRLPRWFSNLLPEGPLREWIAADRGVALDREMELLAQVGHDLPGAVQVVSTSEFNTDEKWEHTPTLDNNASGTRDNMSPWRFSLAGVALKFSMLAKGDRLTIPAVGEHGDWLVKFPDYKFADVPRNEFSVMSMARAVGINTPEVRLLHRDELTGVPPRLWPNSEEWAYGIRRFDRARDRLRTAIHIEDLAQVRDKYPEEKYEGSFDTVAALTYRGRDLEALREFARRVSFNVMIGNGDAHLKNWSLIYLNQRIPTLSPAYDLVSTVQYRDEGEPPEDLGLRFGHSRRFSSVTPDSFRVLESRLDKRFGKTSAELADIAVDTVQRVVAAWPDHREILSDNIKLMSGISTWIKERGDSFLGSQM